MTQHNNISIAITGSGGSGAVTAGLILLEAMAQAGFYGLMQRSAGPQIRGGESAVMLRFADHELCGPADVFDLWLALDWLKVRRFVDEIPLHGGSQIISDPMIGEPPAEVTGQQAAFIDLSLKQTAATVEGGRVNMVGIGVLAAMLGLSVATMHKAIQKTLSDKGKAVISASLAAIEAGMRLVPSGSVPLTANWQVATGERWNISGNEACGLGALRGGVRFVAAYPITPASDMLEWLAPNLEKIGGTLLQAEDELASINMIVGASFGGVASLTATSGPGLSLMLEGIGLAVASETPITVVNVMRGGPSTGIPTKSEQADLNQALYGPHGDAPHLVLAPLGISDAVFTTQWAVCLAERLQTATIVLSDQSIGQARAIVSPVPETDMLCTRQTAQDIDGEYRRYTLTPDGISPMAIPGTPYGMYTADGLEHNEKGTPSSMAADHNVQLTKRSDKLLQTDYGEHWAEIAADDEAVADYLLLTWGSVSGVVSEGAGRLRDQGYSVTVVAVRLLMPLPLQQMKNALSGAKKILVVEHNYSAQFYHYLMSLGAIPQDASSLARPGPLPLRPGEIVTTMTGEQHE
ncbi:MAG: 2-oxoacid:acceptor oxidoreductase subunit alpha [Gammaproteobacteria bacterium]|nr:2-oxoacid:acceptor oxidoreductase subunit alpha [Gammaproteobacteria bacterium]